MKKTKRTAPRAGKASSEPSKRALRVEKPGPLPATPPRSVISASVPLEAEYVGHPERGITLERVGAIFDQAEQGYTARQCDLFTGLIEIDGHCRAQFGSRSDAVAGKTWLAQAGGDRQVDKLAAERLQDALEEVPNWQDAVEYLLTHNPFGFAGVEVEWGHRNGWNVPVWFELVPHRRFRFVNEMPRLLTVRSPIDGEPLEAGSWIFHRRGGSQIARAGLMRTAAWLCIFKGWGLRDWVLFAQRFGVPLILGKYDQDMQTDEKRALKEAVRALGRDGRAILPELAKIEIVTVEKGGTADGIHSALIQTLDRQMSKLITGATLTMESGTQGGSYALADVHQDTRFDLIDGDAFRLGRRIAMDLGTAFTKFNGLNAKPPFIVWNVVREVDPLKRIQIADFYVNKLGGKLSDDQIRREFQFKKPRNAEDELAGAAPPAGAAAAPADPPATKPAPDPS